MNHKEKPLWYRVIVRVQPYLFLACFAMATSHFSRTLWMLVIIMWALKKEMDEP